MNTTTTQVPHNVHPRLFQESSSMPTTSLKLNPYGKDYLHFETEGGNFLSITLCQVNIIY